MTPTPTGIRRSTKYIPEVESLRGIAIALVFFHHADGLLTPQLAGEGVSVSALRAFVAGGHTGVSLFFVLSAFCLSTPFFGNIQKRAPFSIRQFYARRALRILPMYWAVVGTGTILTSQTAIDLLRALPWSVFLNSFPGVATPMAPYTNVMWSLATEAQFYLLLPLLPAVLRSPAGRNAGLIAFTVYAVFYFAFLAGFASPLLVNRSDWVPSLFRTWYFSLSVFGRGPVLLVGIAVAWIHARYGETIAGVMRSSAILRHGGSDLLLVVALGALGYLLRWQVSLGFWTAELPPHQAWHVVEGLLWGSVLLILLEAPLHSKAVLSNRVLGSVGRWSFSIYLLHVPLIIYGFLWIRVASPGTFDGWNTSSAAAVLLLAVVCTAMSACTYRWIESPFLQRKARLEN